MGKGRLLNRIWRRLRVAGLQEQRGGAFPQYGLMGQKIKLGVALYGKFVYTIIIFSTILNLHHKFK